MFAYVGNRSINPLSAKPYYSLDADFGITFPDNIKMYLLKSEGLD